MGNMNPTTQTDECPKIVEDKNVVKTESVSPVVSVGHAPLNDCDVKALTLDTLMDKLRNIVTVLSKSPPSSQPSLPPPPPPPSSPPQSQPPPLTNQDLEFLYQTVRKKTFSSDDRLSLISVIVQANFCQILENVLTFFLSKSLNELKCLQKWSEYKKMLSIAWIISDCDVTFCQQMSYNKNIVYLLVVMSQKLTTDLSFLEFEPVIYTLKSVLGLLHNIHRYVDEAREIFRKTNLMSILQTGATCKSDMIKAKCWIILSYIVSDTETDALAADHQILKFLLHILQVASKSNDHCSKRHGMSVIEITQGLNNLSVNDSNKLRLGKLGIIQTYMDLLSDCSTEEQLQLTHGLWRLSFHPSNKTIMRQSDLIQVLESLKSSSDEKIRHAVCGTLWELRPQPPDLELDKNEAKTEASSPHIMISYQWNSQRVMVKVKDKLKHAGYKVWMDVEHMTGSTLEAMALAVEKAAVILICMSQKYKDSPSCRSEAEYVYKLRKSFVPLRVQTDYIADGWLGMMIGTKLYFDFSKGSCIEEQIPNLIKELGHRGKICGIDSVDGITEEMTTTPGYVAKVTTSKSCCRWTTQEVNQWVGNLKLTIKDEIFGELDGELLIEMKNMLHTSPDYLYTSLQNDFHMTFIDVIKFSKALRNL